MIFGLPVFELPRKLWFFRYSNTLAKSNDLHIKIHLDDPVVAVSCQASVIFTLVNWARQER